MQRALLCLYIAFFIQYALAANSGLVELDEHSFQKLLNKFDAALVKFDVAYPYGDKHEAFAALALETKDVEELLVADVNVKDYGDKENEALALKYNASKDNFPVVKLFVKGRSEPVPFDESKGFTTEALRAFVRANSGIYLSLPGCLQQLDEAAARFVAGDEDSRKKVLQQVIVDNEKLAEKYVPVGKAYKSIMEKMLEKGDGFIKTEMNRVKKLLSGKVSQEKKMALNHRLNILSNFKFALDKKNKNDEL